MFYLMMHSTHLLKDYSDSERGNLLPPLHGLLFLISSKGSIVCTIPDRTVHATFFVTPVISESRRHVSDLKQSVTGITPQTSYSH